MFKMKLKIESNITEQNIMESLLNMRYSGVGFNIIIFLLSFHALVNEWHYKKLNYYLRLLEI